MGRVKTIVKVPIEETRCWSCSLLEKTVGGDSTTGQIVKRYRCPRNAVLPDQLPPYFAEKCELYRRKV
ncbi:hypothetical protein KEJ37_00145 [Candidatus Bathyarchaeota archaeon]|nr:hypothetical protein [Candidatus Bathyarchaeota archaeon]